MGLNKFFKKQEPTETQSSKEIFDKGEEVARQFGSRYAVAQNKDHYIFGYCFRDTTLKIDCRFGGDHTGLEKCVIIESEGRRVFEGVVFSDLKKRRDSAINTYLPGNWNDLLEHKYRKLLN